MKSLFQIPRTSLIWVLASLVSVILPHLLRMPVWLTALCAGCIAMRILIFQGKVSYPGSKVKTLVVVATVFFAVTQYGRDIFSTDATVGILIVGIALKLIEMHTKRDVLLVIFLCYFAGVAEFIYSQSIPVAIYMFFSMAVISSALMSLNQTEEFQKPARTFKLSIQILAQSIPLMLALFILFPRISPLWSVPLQSNSGVTGLSDTMSPGDIGQLIGSPEVAFKVQFDGDIPENNLLYWRGITLDLFNGREWRRRNTRFNTRSQYLGLDPREYRSWFADIQYSQNPVSYNIILEPTYQNWLFTLKLPQIRREGLFMIDTYQVESATPVTQRLSYDVTSWLVHETSQSLSGEVRRRSLLLPEEGNVSSRQFAQQLRESSESDLDYANAVLTHFREESFYYTIEPEMLGEHTIDDFLFDTREGFCEHYSSAFTFLMRAAGIPSRVVTGYQGGEVNPYDNTLIVRQYDAHAWSEIWIEGEGWIRVDPTAAVAPQRISLGSELTFQEDEGFLRDAGFSHLLFRNNALINELRYRIEAIDYAWNRWVLNYDQNTQFELFSRIFGVVTKQKILLTVFAFMFFSFAVLTFFILRGSKGLKQSPETISYLKFCQIMDKFGYPRSAGETPAHYCERVIKERPVWKDVIIKITRLYTDLAYVPEDKNSKKDFIVERKQKLAQLKSAVHQFRVLN